MTDEELAATRPLLEKMVSNSRFLWTDKTEINQALASGEIVAAYAWNETVEEPQGTRRADQIRAAQGRHLHLAVRLDAAQHRQGG